MFDKLVESSSTGADLKPRRRIFVASFFFVAVLFVTAVIASIYAADFDLGTHNFDIAELLTPVTDTEPQPEPQPERTRQHNHHSATSPVPIRRVIMASTDDFTRVPTVVSTAVNPYRSTSPNDYNIARTGNADLDPPPNGGGSDRGSGSGYPGTVKGSDDGSAIPKEPPPPVEKPDPKPTTKSLGVITGKASHLPKPPYPSAAKAVGASGAVNVQVTIDEEGNVISAKALGGHILLRRVAEEAALKAKFSPTTLSKVPVKVTGVIVYNFTR